MFSDYFLSCAFFSSVSVRIPKIDVRIQSMWAVTVVPLTPGTQKQASLKQPWLLEHLLLQREMNRVLSVPLPMEPSSP